MGATSDDNAMAVAARPDDDDDNDSVIDDTGDFIDMNEAVEVNVDDDDVPMEGDDDEEDEAVEVANDTENMTGADVEVNVPDMSKTKIVSHTDSVYTVACHLQESATGGQVLSILSGGGDDKSFLHHIVPTGSTTSGGSSAETTTMTASSLPLSYNHTDTVSCVAFNLAYISEDLKKTPRLAAVGSFDGAILLYDPDSGEQKLKLEGPSDVEWLCFHPKGGSVLLAGSGDGTVWMFHIPLNKCLQVFVGHEQGVTAGAFSPDGKWALSVSADGTLRVWAPKTGASRHVFRFGNVNEDSAPLTCLATNGGADGQLVMVGAENGMAHVVHIGTKKVVASLRHVDPTAIVNARSAKNDDDDEEEEMDIPMSVEAVGFSPQNPNWCASASVDGTLKIWDLARDGQCRQTCRVTTTTEEEDYRDDGITRLQWHPTLPVIFTATSRGRINIWDVRNGSLVHTLTGHTEMINELDIQFLSGNGAAVIVSAGDDKTIRVFDVDIAALLQQRQ
jgi:angio-associated migratory cell protein